MCEKKFGQNCSLLLHQRTIHEGLKDYECDKCDKKFGSQSNLINHQKTVHEGRKDFACDMCEKKFGERSGLIKHQKIVHQGRKDYRCDKCEKKFGDPTRFCVISCIGVCVGAVKRVSLICAAQEIHQRRFYHTYNIIKTSSLRDDNIILRRRLRLALRAQSLC
ncbi:unnamed protein product [Trichogramma brassicae]|uniref:C2H2-type domain-containing protein n=1 Tax=Trichogramma brassicae TaxID=86971 RepID=A0A6H5HYY3_9HYME|nr:unnamed protein product [Trichogramma brassicae]